MKKNNDVCELKHQHAKSHFSPVDVFTSKKQKEDRAKQKKGINVLLVLEMHSIGLWDVTYQKNEKEMHTMPRIRARPYGKYWSDIVIHHNMNFFPLMLLVQRASWLKPEETTRLISSTLEKKTKQKPNNVSFHYWAQTVYLEVLMQTKDSHYTFTLYEMHQRSRELQGRLQAKEK